MTLEDTSEILFPPRLKKTYTNFFLLEETSYYKVYEATSKQNQQIHTIRVLDADSSFVIRDHNAAVTLFLQEILHLCLRLKSRDSIVIENFEYFEGNIAFVMRNSKPLETLFSPNQTKLVADTDRMLKDLLLDIEFLSSKLNRDEIKVNPKSVWQIGNQYFIADWGACNYAKVHSSYMEKLTKTFTSGIGSQSVPDQLSNYIAPEYMNNGFKVFGNDIAVSCSSELYSLGLMLLTASGVDEQTWKELPKIPEQQKYELMLKGLIEKMQGGSELRDLAAKLLQQNPLKRVTLENLITNHCKVNRSLFRMAWCTYQSNVITIFNMQSNQRSRPFEGAQLNLQGYYTLTESIPDSNLLVSSIKRMNHFSSFQIFDVSRDNNPLTVYDSGRMIGQISDIACNSKMNYMSLLSVTNKTAYHLFDCTSFEIIRTAKWQPQNAYLINSLDFEPEGQKIATIDYDGVLSVLDVNSDDVLFYKKLMSGGHSNYYNRCRWNRCEPIVATKIFEKKLNLIDVEKEFPIHREPLTLDTKAVMWIDWRRDGNLLACCGEGRNIKVYDRREGNIVRTFNMLHNDWVHSVRWSPCGKMLASASADSTVKLIDFKSGKILLTQDTSNGHWAYSVCFL